MSVVQLLRRNDPGTIGVVIRLQEEPSDADLAQALEQNPFVTEITLDLEGVQQTEWISLLRVISMRANLETVGVWDSLFSERRNAPVALVRSILRAIQQNTAIRSVEMRWMSRLPTDISMYVNTASFITSFHLNGCDMDPAERQQGIPSLAAALRQNTSIQTLRLSCLEDIYVIPILEGLRTNETLKSFAFSPNSVYFSDAGSHALQQLLESTTSIQRFELSAAFLRPAIAQGITSSECVSELVFSTITFWGDRNSLAPLQSILQNKRNLTYLCFHECHIGGGQVLEDIISILSRPDSLLRCFGFWSGVLEGEFPRIQFENLLQAIQKSKLLERFQIGAIVTQQQLQSLSQSIPTMRIRELDVQFDGQILREPVNPRQNLLRAIRNNFSLRSVKGQMQNDELFGTPEDKQRLAFYISRNESLDRWVNNPNNPEMVDDRKVWPDALGLAERAGPNALFRGLRSVLEHDYVSLPGRKRKRPPQEAPS